MARHIITQAGDFVEVHDFQMPLLEWTKGGGGGWNMDRVRTKENARQAIRKFTNLCREGCARVRGVPHLVTLTIATDSERIPDNMKDTITRPLDFDSSCDISSMYRMFSLFIKRMEYNFPDLSYIAVPEYQKRGSVHFHCLMWGLPDDTSIRERGLRTISKIWSHGYVDVILTDGSPKMAHYLIKYMRKSCDDKRLYGKKMYVRSRGFPEPCTSMTDDTYQILHEILTSAVQLLCDKTYYSEWLGNCRYRLYYNPYYD